MTADQRRIVVAVCLIYFLSLMMIGGLTFLVPPMAENLKLADDTVENLLAVPSVAALVAVFSAGQLGERFGPRRAIAIAGLCCTIGASVMIFATGSVAAQLGLSIYAAAGITIQIVGISLLQTTTVTGPAQVSAFTTFGTVAPLAFVIIPVATAGLLDVADWRLVPLFWAIAGILIIVVALRWLDRGSGSPSTGEWVTPLLAGLSLAAAARAIAEVDNLSLDRNWVLIACLVSALAATACAVATRRVRRASFSTSAIRGRMMQSMLLCVALVSCVQLLNLVCIVMEFLYGLSAEEVALATVPAQLAAAVGAKVLATKAINRWGGFRAGRNLLLAIAVTMLPLLALTQNSPAWILVVVTMLFSFTTMGALTAFNAEVMRRSPSGGTEAASSFRSAASSIGGALGVGIFGAIMLSGTRVDVGSAAVTAGARAEMVAGLRLAGLIACSVAIAGSIMLTLVERRSPADGQPIAPAA